MLRFVVSPAGDLVPDLAASLPGRGIWLSARRDVLDSARTRNLFAKAARQVVRVPDDLNSLVQVGLEKRVNDCLTLARRAGDAICGFTKCREWITARRAGVLIHDPGASPDEVARLLSGAKDLPRATVAVGTLAKAFGREHAVYAVVARGALAERLRAEHERLMGIAQGQAPGACDARSGLEQAGK